MSHLDRELSEKAHGPPELPSIRQLSSTRLSIDGLDNEGRGNVSASGPTPITTSSATTIRSDNENPLSTTPKDEEEGPSSSTPPPGSDIPDGGVLAWLQIFGAFSLYMNSWGLISAYGIFQTIYETSALESHSPFQISIIGSLQTFLMVFFSLFVGPIMDAGYFRLLIAVGSALIVIGTLLQSFSVYYWQYILTQGVLVGLGASCLNMTCVTIPSMWFSKRLPVANALAASGSGLGGVLIPIMLHRLESSIGLGWATRAVTLLIAVLLLSANFVLRPRGPLAIKRAPRSLVDMDTFRDTPFIVVILGIAFVFLGLYTPYIYIQSFAISTKVTSSYLGFYILAILNSSSIVGRILPSLIANKVGSMNMFVVTVFALAITAFGLITADSLAKVIAAAIVYGFFAGSYFATMPTVGIRLIGNPKVIGTRMGMAFAFLSIPSLFGPPISGVLLDVHHDFKDVWIWSGATLVVGGVIIAISRVLKGGFTWKGAF